MGLKSTLTDNILYVHRFTSKIWRVLVMFDYVLNQFVFFMSFSWKYKNIKNIYFSDCLFHVFYVLNAYLK